LSQIRLETHHNKQPRMCDGLTKWSAAAWTPPRFFTIWSFVYV
jgi:hypothetical protein